MNVRRLVSTTVLAFALGLSHAQAWAAVAAADVAPATSQVALDLSRRIREVGDNGQLPFLVIDKLSAQVLVFDADGRLLGATAALLGSARGDESTPGIGDRALSSIRPEERTTPAGRYLAGFGAAAGKDDEFWVDYASAVALHPVITSNPKEARLKRLKSPGVDDNRITYGCINVDRSFFNNTIRPTFKATRGVAYILPDTRDITETFPTLAPVQLVEAMDTPPELSMSRDAALNTP
jgi:hypothetical protein